MTENDKKKLLKIWSDLDLISLPMMKDNDADQLRKEIEILIGKTKDHITKKIKEYENS